MPSASMPNAPKCSSILRTTLLPVAMLPVRPMTYFPGQALMRGILVVRVGRVKQPHPTLPIGTTPTEREAGRGYHRLAQYTLLPEATNISLFGPIATAVIGPGRA